MLLSIAMCYIVILSMNAQTTNDVDSVNTVRGGLVNVSITTNGYSDIMLGYHEFTWDEDSISLISIGTTNAILQQHIILIDTVYAGTKQMRVMWIDTTGTDHNLADGSEIFNLQFLANGSSDIYCDQSEMFDEYAISQSVNCAQGYVHISDTMSVGLRYHSDDHFLPKVYPNPTSQRGINILMPQADQVELILTNVLGQIIKRQTIEYSNQGDIEWFSFDSISGAYNMTLIYSGTVVSFRVIVVNN